MAEDEEVRGTLNIVIGVGGNGSLLVDRFARTLRSEPADLLIYACDTHDRPPEVREFHEFVKYIPWSLPSEAQVEKLGIKVKQSHIRRVRESSGEGVLRYRDYSRAAFHHNWSNTLSKIKEDVEGIRGKTILNRLKFMFVTPIGGGTGGGSVIDFAESTKEMFEMYGVCIMDAFFVLPYGFIVKKGRHIIDLTTEEEEDAFSNAFGGLLELREIIGDESKNPFRVISLISSYTLGEWDSVDSVVTRLLSDFYGERLGEIGNIFRGLEAENGFVTMIPAVVEFPLDILEEYHYAHNLIIENEKKKSEKKKELDRYISKEGEDEEKHGSLVKTVRGLTRKVSDGNDKIADIERIERGIPLLKAMRSEGNKEDLKKIYEEMFGINRDRWGELIEKYLKNRSDLATLIGEDLVNGIGLTKEFLEKGKAKDVAIGENILTEDVKGLLDVLIADYNGAWTIHKEVEKLDKEIEKIIQQEKGLADELKDPKISGVIPVDENWLNLFVTGEIDIQPYIKGDRVLFDLFKELEGDAKAAEDFYVKSVGKSLVGLRNTIKDGFFDKLLEKGLEKIGYRGNELRWKFVVASHEDNYTFEPVREIIDDRISDIKRELGIERIEQQKNHLPPANTSLRAYFIIGCMDLNQLPEWETCKEKYMRKTKNVSEPEEAHAWGLEDGIWTKEHVGEVIKGIESPKSD